jgi:hypothetical protein
MWENLKGACAYAWSHKTKIVGYAGMLAGGVQLYLPQLGVFLTEKQMAATTMIIAGTVAAIGHYNDWVKSQTTAPA